MRRRHILAGLLLTLAAPFAAKAQQPGKVARVGITVATDVYYDAFVQRCASWTG
jgi:hypothetical protein